jgi:hypothetical protein
MMGWPTPEGRALWVLLRTISGVRPKFISVSACNVGSNMPPPFPKGIRGSIRLRSAHLPNCSKVPNPASHVNAGRT